MAGRRDALIRRRRLVGLSQEQLGRRIGVDRRTVARWESGESEPHLWNRGDLARALGVTAAELDGMINSPSPDQPTPSTETRVTIAVPQRPGEREFIALEDSATAAQLSKIAYANGMVADVEYIPTSGWIDLNRASLVVVCGPKTSPVTAAALAADPHLAFEQSDGRWELVEHATATRYASPMDDLEHPGYADVAYLGRLPCPNGPGTFLLIAGVHAIGSLGVAHYLAEYPEYMDGGNAARPFSMVVTSRFDPTAKTITNVRALTDPLLHEEG
jgi:transcriptional regulator with XRE-family HTH domain